MTRESFTIALIPPSFVNHYDAIEIAHDVIVGTHEKAMLSEAVESQKSMYTGSMLFRCILPTCGNTLIKVDVLRYINLSL